MSTKRQGSLLSGYALIWVIIGLALGLILLGITGSSWLGIEDNPQQLTGDAKNVGERLANLAEKCWQQHQGSSESAICNVIDLKTEQVVTEANFTLSLDCDILENRDHGCGKRDEVDWEVNCKQCSVKVQYLPGRILIKSLD